MAISSRGLELVIGLTLVAGLTGCATGGNPDPWEKNNRKIYAFNDGLDKYALKPLSDGYVKITPKPVRQSLSNALDNLGYMNVIINDFLQGKMGQGLSDSGRMAVNSTFGIAGLFDLGTPLNMPAHDNDLGLTLAQWGAKPGPYMVLPLFGPTNGRDVGGIPMGIVTNPLTWINPPLGATIPMGVLTAADGRSRAENEFKFRNAAAIDPYLFTRDGYTQYREGLINGGKPKAGPNIYDEDTSTQATQPSTQPATMPSTQPATQPATMPATMP